MESKLQGVQEKIVTYIMPHLSRLHWAAIVRLEKDQPNRVTVHSDCVNFISFNYMLARNWFAAYLQIIISNNEKR